MKRFISFLLSLVMILSLFCGCEKTDISSENSLPQKADLESTSTDSSDTSSELTVSVPEEPKPVISKTVESKPLENKPTKTVNNTEKLSLEKINQIKKEYFQNMGYSKELFDLKKIAFEHYATLSDGSMVVYIIFNPTETDRMKTEIIGEYYCTFNYAKRLQVYKNGIFEHLRYAYDSGFISKTVLDEFFQKCPQFCSGKVNPNKQNPPVIQEPEKVENYGNLDIKIVEKIKAKYLETTSIAKLQKLIITAYYGTFSDGSIAIRFDVVGRINSKENVYKHIGKYWCKYESKLPVTIYKNDKLYKMEDAYKEGVISDKILDEFFAKNPSLNGTKFYESRLIARRKQLQDWLKSPTVKETRSYWKGSADGDFVEGEFIISLTLEASKKNFYKEYTPKDFPEIDCESVEPLGEYQREGILSEKYNDEEVGTLEDLDLSKFRRMFVINLKEKTKQAVYDGIHALDGREDISSASPNHIMYLD